MNGVIRRKTFDFTREANVILNEKKKKLKQVLRNKYHHKYTIDLLIKNYEFLITDVSLELCEL